jgi:hypothetical protein
MINDLLTILGSWPKCKAYDDYIKQLENLNND